MTSTCISYRYSWNRRCEVIAIGNGTGCRNIEKIFSAYIKRGFFEPEIHVQYTIVNERGASIYSCSSVAKEEFPDLDPNLVSAGEYFHRCMR